MAHLLQISQSKRHFVLAVPYRLQKTTGLKPFPLKLAILLCLSLFLSRKFASAFRSLFFFCSLLLRQFHIIETRTFNSVTNQVTWKHFPFGCSILHAIFADECTRFSTIFWLCENSRMNSHEQQKKIKENRFPGNGTSFCAQNNNTGVSFALNAE